MAFKNTQGKKNVFPFQMNLNWKLGGQEIEFASIFDTLYTFVNTYILKRKRSSFKKLLAIPRISIQFSRKILIDYFIGILRQIGSILMIVW